MMRVRSSIIATGNFPTSSRTLLRSAGSSSHSIDRSSVGPNSIVSINGAGQRRSGGKRIRCGVSTSTNFTIISSMSGRASPAVANSFRHFESDINAAEKFARAKRPAALGSCVGMAAACMGRRATATGRLPSSPLDRRPRRKRGGKLPLTG